MNRFLARAVAAATLLLGSLYGFMSQAHASAPSLLLTAAAMSTADLDRLMTRTMKQFAIPGAAVGIVKDGRTVFAKGYGVRELEKSSPVDTDTLFAIGSNTKAFTTAALAILVDEGRLHWDDRVIDHLPAFRMWDPYVTREFTVRDLLTHRSGLGTGAGDLLFVTATDFTRDDLLRALRYLKPVTSFRSQFAYDNLLYVIAGQIIPVVSGQSWEDFVTTRILQPLHMQGCAVDISRVNDRSNVAAPHLVSQGKLTQVPPLSIPVVAPAGAIQCNISGMSQWLLTQLARGRSPEGTTIFSDARSSEMWTPQTLLPVEGEQATLTRTHFLAYALGWVAQDFDGYKRVSHDGGLPGMVTHVSLIPELNLGVVVLTNQQEVDALDAVALQILQSYTGAPHRDWVALSAAARAKREEQIHSLDAKRRPATANGSAAGTWQPPDLNDYVGKFTDPWRGAASVTREADSLQLTFSHTAALSGPLQPVAPGLFIVHWKDRSLDADAYVRFAEDFAGHVTGFTMHAVSASTDFSFDFQDLDFRREEPPH
jgi:CubicO group peptidase (beta-lactamase class C family)